MATGKWRKCDSTMKTSRVATAMRLEILIVVFLTLCCVPAATQKNLRWCVVSDAEKAKCTKFVSVLQQLRTGNEITDAEKAMIPETITCVQAVDVFECMKLIEAGAAHIIRLDAGQGYFAGRYHNMMPIMSENYQDTPMLRPTYYAVTVFRTNNPVNINTLRGKNVCFPGIGMSAGWLYPISKLLERNIIPVTECNAIVKSVTSFFQNMCLPGALTSFYNPFGNNPTSVCHLCNGMGEERCTTSDPSAGFDGAFKCVAHGRGDLTFLRHDTVTLMAQENPLRYNVADFSLLCPDNTVRPVSDYQNCHWGIIPSDIVMTSAIVEPQVVSEMKQFLKKSSEWFRESGRFYNRFKLFKSNEQYDDMGRVFERRNLMFSDATRKLEDIGDHTYYTWVGEEFNGVLDSMQRCPLQTAKWCVTSIPEKEKCEEMILALKAKDLRPQLDCMLGENTTDCMDMIAKGDADLMNLDAGDVYLAGKKYGLIPIAAEDYGDMSMKFKVVAAARKTDKSLTLFNMKGKRACQPGIGRGDGWVIPLNIYIETEQFLPGHCTIFDHIGQLFIRSCIPGALDKEYNPWQKPINLCEGCGANGFRKCKRNSEEQYYGASGAFRCLTELGGDVAFVRHLTVRDNTDGRNAAVWARNRRSDDYELLCKDGRRVGIDNFAECHLGEVPANTIVTARYKDPQEREIFWNLLNYGQQFFSSDIDGDFHMFDSGSWYTDLMFTDAAVRLMKIEPSKQNYRDWLGETFLGQVENLEYYTCVKAGANRLVTPSLLLLTLMAVIHRFLS